MTMVKAPKGEKLLTVVTAVPVHYSQIPQVINTKFAWAKLDLENNTVTENHTPVLCRDFLNDTLAWRAAKPGENLPQSFYGFSYKDFVHEDNTIFVQTIPKEWRVGFSLGILLLNALEDQLGVEKTRVLHTTQENKIVTIGDSVWMTTTIHLSFYTALLRYMCTATKETKTIQEAIEKKTDECTRALLKYPAPVLGAIILKLPFKGVRGAKEPWDMHNCNGFVTMTNQYATMSNYSAEFKGAL